MKKESTSSANPNIILINCDDLGYGDLGCYGSTVNQTPHIDRLASEGIRFTDFYMASSVCSASRAAMLTGCYPPRIGFGGVLFPGDAYGLHPREITIASLLKQKDYATMLIGKWHCGDQPDFLPTQYGFDSYYGLPYSNDMGMQAPDPERYPPLPLIRNNEVIEEQPDLASLAGRYLEESVRFIRNNKNNPFFLYLAHMYVHLPLYPPERFLNESKNGRYGAAVSCIDWMTGTILHELQQLGIEEKTLIIFTSDNGSRGRNEGGSNAPLRGGKGTTWEGGQRVPCIMRFPETIPKNSISKEIITSMDFLPTIAELCDIPIPTDRIIDGKSITALLKSPHSTPSPHTAFFYYRNFNLEAIRSNNWKLHVRKGTTEIRELYNLNTDIHEEHNVYHDHPQIIKKLEKLLETCRHDIGDASHNITGENIRPAGHVKNPVTLTRINPKHPYYIAMYDLEERG